jgi:hypothetical protein
VNFTGEVWRNTLSTRKDGQNRDTEIPLDNKRKSKSNREEMYEIRRRRRMDEKETKKEKE